MAKRSIDDIATSELLLVKRRKGEPCFRIHRSIHEPLWFGPDRKAPASGRFSAPGHEYGVCYFGMSFDVAFAETLLRNPASRLLSRADLAERSISSGHLAREIQLAQLHGAGLTRLGITAGMVHGPHDACRSLALALWKHPARVDGIAYRSRFDNDEICIALFDRARGAVMIDITEGLAEDEMRLGRMLDKYDVGLDP